MTTALTAQSPTSVNLTFSNYRYSIQINSGITPTKALVIGGVVTFQRCSIDSNGLYTDDPTQGSSQSVAIGDLNAFATANPSLAALIETAWSELDAFVDALNQLQKLV